MQTVAPADFNPSNPSTPLMLDCLSRSLRRGLSAAVRRTGPLLAEVAAPHSGRGPAEGPRTPPSGLGRVRP